jgi:transketolase C-terminal domain/subunit
MRTGSAVLYPSDYSFEYGKGYVLRQSDTDKAILLSSGRGVHEALGAADLCAKQGLGVMVVDMPSVDGDLLLKLYQSGLPIVLAEQNNGFLLQNFLKLLYRHRTGSSLQGLDRLTTINTLRPNGDKQFIHSATYEELVEVFGLTQAAIAAVVQRAIQD